MPTIADYSPLTRVQVKRLTDYLYEMIHHAEELGCTCGERSKSKSRNGHQKNCTGIDITRSARAYLTRLKRAR